MKYKYECYTFSDLYFCGASEAKRNIGITLSVNDECFMNLTSRLFGMEPKQ